jgi:hypothetical protein
MALGIGSPVQYRAPGGIICAAIIIGVDSTGAPSRLYYFDYTSSTWSHGNPGLTRDDAQATDNSYTVTTIA